ncbi:hypothetical protein [Streptomyces fulvoviolaceus]|uniref:hypothetical protein n=1 Tax=Streptomyces fulvoviolaceus TaxID=285535 RepID=UPI0030B80A91
MSAGSSAPNTPGPAPSSSIKASVGRPRAWPATSVPKNSTASGGRVTPVPGGVGPTTIAMLLVDTLRTAQRSPGPEGRAISALPHVAW